VDSERERGDIEEEKQENEPCRLIFLFLVFLWCSMWRESGVLVGRGRDLHLQNMVLVRAALLEHAVQLVQRCDLSKCTSVTRFIDKEIDEQAGLGSLTAAISVSFVLIVSCSPC